MIRMILDNILVLPDVDDGEIKMTAGGIYMAPSRDRDPSITKPAIGIVIDVGPGAWYFGNWVEPTLSIGDRVQYRPNTGFLLEHDDNQYVCLKEADIMAVITE